MSDVMAVDPELVERARETIRRFKVIVSDEMLVHGTYVTEVHDPSRLDAPCGGRNACAVGALFLAYGLSDYLTSNTGEPLFSFLIDGLHSVFAGRGRCGLLEREPALRLAYDAMNDAAVSWAGYHHLNVPGWAVRDSGGLEALFERATTPTGAYVAGRPELLEVANMALHALGDAPGA